MPEGNPAKLGGTTMAEGGGRRTASQASVSRFNSWATSNRALARTQGVSETAVRKAEKSGRIRRAGYGSWNVEKVKAAWRGNTDPVQRRDVPKGLRPVPEPPSVQSSRLCMSRDCPSRAG